jgi:hypothetical protein
MLAERCAAFNFAGVLFYFPGFEYNRQSHFGCSGFSGGEKLAMPGGSRISGNKDGL